MFFIPQSTSEPVPIAEQEVHEPVVADATPTATPVSNPLEMGDLGRGLHEYIRPLCCVEMAKPTRQTMQGGRPLKGDC